MQMIFESLLFPSHVVAQLLHGSHDKVFVICSRARWFVAAYTKEEVRELLSNNLRSRPPDSEAAELTMPRSFSNNV